MGDIAGRPQVPSPGIGGRAGTGVGLAGRIGAGKATGLGRGTAITIRISKF